MDALIRSLPEPARQSRPRVCAELIAHLTERAASP